MSEPLREMQHGRCFYCERVLPAAVAVDHFIPWSRYPSDLLAIGTEAGWRGLLATTDWPYS